GVYGTSGRIEKGYRLQGAELESEYNPLEAGLARPKVKSADFIGKDAYLGARESGDPEVLMVTMTVDDQTDAHGRTRWMQGGNEPICDLDGNTLMDSHQRVCRVTTAGYGPSVEKMILMGYVPREMAVPGTKLQTVYMNEFFSITVVGTDGPFDPTDSRLKG
ncbi:MAG: glycine cleavage T C-terminal barrel domain-containing protein, partial [Ilumatobacter sp.]|nr:glycine cleavage T C-terminal barrel domain-containing protein [Ilumatobacter sp.]